MRPYRSIARLRHPPRLQTESHRDDIEYGIARDSGRPPPVGRSQPAYQHRSQPADPAWHSALPEGLCRRRASCRRVSSNRRIRRGEPRASSRHRYEFLRASPLSRLPEFGRYPLIRRWGSAPRSPTVPIHRVPARPRYGPARGPRGRRNAARWPGPGDRARRATRDDGVPAASV